METREFIASVHSTRSGRPGSLAHEFEQKPQIDPVIGVQAKFPSRFIERARSTPLLLQLINPLRGFIPELIDNLCDQHFSRRYCWQ